MEIKAYGYTTTDNPSSSAPAELSEVTIVAGPRELRRIAEFLNVAADAIETHGERFDHEHLSEASPDWRGENTDLIVSRPS